MAIFSLSHAIRRLARHVAALAVAATLLTALSVSPAQAQCRQRSYRPRVTYAQPYSYGYPGNYNSYYSYDPYYRRSSKTKDFFTVAGPAAGGALVGGLAGGKKGAIIGAAIGAGIGTAVVVKRHRDRNRFPFPF